jgi:hypothetical protein
VPSISEGSGSRQTVNPVINDREDAMDGMSSEFNVNEWGANAKLIAEAEAKGHIVSIGSDGQDWIVNSVEDPDRTTT